MTRRARTGGPTFREFLSRSSPGLAPASLLLLVHDLGSEEAIIEGLQLGEVDGAKADSQLEVQEGKLAGRRLKPDAVDSVGHWVKW